MTQEELDKIVEEATHKKHGRGGASMLTVRRVLNVIFMIFAVIGVIAYFTAGHMVGFVIMSIALVLKIIEFFLRFLF
jgi:hypothetical protein